MNLSAAKTLVDVFFRGYAVNARSELNRRGQGKVYELYCLAKTIEYIKTFVGVSVQFIGTRVDFKSSPGKIDKTRSYFVIYGHGWTLELHTDIEVRTLSSTHVAGTPDLSSYHGIDLVLVGRAQHGQRPAYNQIVLGVECKSHANFEKEILKQVLGVRRELSLFGVAPSNLRALLGGLCCNIHANPPSEYWLAFTDPKGGRYRKGPAVFAIEFKHWCPP